METGELSTRTNNFYDHAYFSPYEKPPSPGSKVHVANMGSTWFLLAPSGPHVGPTDLAISATLK